MLQNRPEPLLDLLTLIELPGHTPDLPRVAPVTLLTIPYVGDTHNPCGLAWKYGGPELLVRGPVSLSTEGRT